MSDTNLSIQRSLHDVVRACRQGSTAMCHSQIELHAARICARTKAKETARASTQQSLWNPTLSSNSVLVRSGVGCPLPQRYPLFVDEELL